MQGQIDEVKSKRFMQMSYVEFLEALARLADMVSFPPATDDYKMKYQTLIETKKTLHASSTIRPTTVEESSEEEETKNFEEMSPSERADQPVHKKIENILPNLLLFCTSNKFMKQWVWPTKHPKYDLYENKTYKVNVIKKLASRPVSRTFFHKLGIHDIVEEAVRKKRALLEVP